MNKKPVLRAFGLLLLTLEAACAGVKGAPPAVPVPLVVDAALIGTRGDRPVPKEPQGPVTEATVVTPLAPALAPQAVATASESVADVPAPTVESHVPAKVTPAPARLPVRPSAPVTPSPVSPGAAPAMPAPGNAAAIEPPLDVAALKLRLRETVAIGMFTKLALKNQFDDLLTMFRIGHEGGDTQKVSIPSLRQPYNALVAKVVSLIQEGDPPLARTILGSREAIWGILADPQKFKAAT